MKNAKSAFYFILMHLGFIIYAGYAILGKIAGQKDFFSAAWIMIYCAVFSILLIYAIIWQQVLKVIPLMVATANKTITIVWGIIFGRLIFNEEVKLNMIIGAAVIIAGIVVLSLEKSDSEEASAEIQPEENKEELHE